MEGATTTAQWLQTIVTILGTLMVSKLVGRLSAKMNIALLSFCAASLIVLLSEGASDGSTVPSPSTSINYRLLRCLKTYFHGDMTELVLSSFASDLLKRCRQAHTPAAVLDIGANKGQELDKLMTLYTPCDRRGLRIVVMEPNPLHNDNLEKVMNAHTSSIRNRTVYYNNGAGPDSAHGTALVLHLPVGRSHERAHLIPLDSGLHSSQSPQGVRVKVYSPRKILEEHGLSDILLATIDTEGLDGIVLHTLLPALRESRDPLVVWELSWSWMRFTPKIAPSDVTAFLNDAGFDVFMFGRLKNKPSIPLLVKLTKDSLLHLDSTLRWECGVALKRDQPLRQTLVPVPREVLHEEVYKVMRREEERRRKKKKSSWCLHIDWSEDHWSEKMYSQMFTFQASLERFARGDRNWQSIKK